MSFNNNSNTRGGNNVHLHGVGAAKAAQSTTTTAAFVGHAMTPSPYYFPQPHFSVSGCYYYNYPPPGSPSAPGFFPPPNGMMGARNHFMFPHLPMHHPARQQMQRHPFPPPALGQHNGLGHFQYPYNNQSSQSLNTDAAAANQPKKTHHRRRHNKTKCKFY